jgi:hypothetical protein
MLNLNYNINKAQVGVGGEVRQGFAPYINNDPYSGSIVLAIPGALFQQGYTNLFGMDNVWSDISSYVKGAGNQIGNNYVIIPSGTGIVTGSSSLTKWDSLGYNTSLYLTGSVAVGSVTSSAGTGVNLSTSSNWCVEAWVAFDTTASLAANPNEFGNPYRRLVWKQEGGNNPLVDSYALDIWTGVIAGGAGYTGNLPSPFPSSSQSGSLRIVTDVAGATPEIIYYATSSAASNPIVPYQWNHVAFSYTQNDNGQPNRNVYRAFWNGRMIIEQQPSGSTPVLGTNQINQFPNKPAQLMGTTSGSGYSNSYFQDFRMYNGTNKNYTASFDVNDVYSIVVARPQ